MTTVMITVMVMITKIALQGFRIIGNVEDGYIYIYIYICMITAIVTMKINVQNDDGNCICFSDFLVEVRDIIMAIGVSNINDFETENLPGCAFAI